jgi:hypothetical protein
VNVSSIFLIFNNFADVDDDTLVAVSRFEELGQLRLNGEERITDAGLEHLKGLQQLHELDLGECSVSPEAVERLRQALPKCKVMWQPKLTGDITESQQREAFP